MPSTKYTKKSQSQKIRSKLYILWELKGSNDNFEDYYNKITDHIINKIDKELSKYEQSYS